MKIFIDLFSGLGGASQAFEAATDWRTIKIDNNIELLDHNRGLQILDISDTEEVIRMIETQFPNGCHLNCDKLVIWASPPCTEFSYANATRNHRQTAEDFDLTLIEAALQIIDHFQPDHWIIENVHGLVPIMDSEFNMMPTQSIGSIVMWGDFPLIGIRARDSWLHRKLDAKGSRSLRPNYRAKIPEGISSGLLASLECQTSLKDWISDTDQEE